MVLGSCLGLPFWPPLAPPKEGDGFGWDLVGVLNRKLIDFIKMEEAYIFIYFCVELLEVSG